MLDTNENPNCFAWQQAKRANYFKSNGESAGNSFNLKKATVLLFPNPALTPSIW